MTRFRKTTYTSIATLLLAIPGAAREPAPPIAHDSVRIVIHDAHNTPLDVVNLGRHVAAEEFRAAGIELQWGSKPAGSPLSEPLETIEVLILGAAPLGSKPAALAEALPFAGSGTRIRIYYDRVAASGRAPLGRLFGYVLAHEIAHVLIGTDGHSGDGILKGSWSNRDHEMIAALRLHFAPADVEMIHTGLEQRRHNRLTASEIAAAKRENR